MTPAGQIVSVTTLLLTLSISSRDTMGATVAESKALYHDLATRHPSNALALNHETSGAYPLLPHSNYNRF